MQDLVSNGHPDLEKSCPPWPRPGAAASAQDADSEKQGGSPNRRILVTCAPEDTLNPQNWSLGARCKNIAILAFLIFVQGWAGASESMANSVASSHLHVSQVLENLDIAMYLFGVGIGSQVAGPLSETVGRNPVYLIATFCYLFFVLGSAKAATFGGRITCRLFVGLFSSATLSINGSSVRDQFRDVKRAFVFPIIAWVNVIGPVVAPIASGWLVANPSLGWRWPDWLTLMISGAAFLVALLFLPETYLPLLLEWKAKELRRLTGDQRYYSEHAASSSLPSRLKHNLKLGVTFFSTEVIVTVLGLYLLLLYTLLFTSLSGFDYIFKETYGLSTGLTGSCFASIAVGSTIFTVSAPSWYLWARRATAHVHGASVKPEFRLWPAIITSPMLPVCLFWLGWTNYPTISIWSGLAACCVFGIVLTAFYVSSYEYIIDSYGDHSAIALASITSLRYLAAGGMVMATRPMYSAIGVHWTMTLLGCVATILSPAPILFWFYGPRLRRHSKFAKDPEQDSGKSGRDSGKC
ncbi:MFS general substrate transporter [Trichoderma longibrachiatum ATCC 18648]|uniref:MFS general substrate transporter n=1 Tax=Trichoderma longibrachiatum ATCC 18648 TaxID=983965 RepID=A0A2T4BTG1_TRILO|nr:MFS general substrate transporter [Trichoderma longibrachiatum ATCC 18648]